MPSALIVTTLSVEYLTVRAYLTNPQEIAHPQGTIYEQGQFAANGQTWDICITEIGAGNSGVTVITERAISFFNPDVILFVGVAGGIKDVSLGDVVASTKIYGYESGKAEDAFRVRPVIELKSTRLEQRAKLESQKSDWLKRLQSKPSSVPKVYVAPIVVGERVAASNTSKIPQFIQSNFEDAVAVDMESIGFLRATLDSQQVSTLIIRGISELIRENIKIDQKKVNGNDGREQLIKEKNSRLQEIAAQNASAFAFDLLSKLTTLEVLAESGSLLRDRYRILRVVAAGGFEVTALAKDSSIPGEPTCIVKQLAIKANYSSSIRERVRKRFIQETRILGKLGSHKQIPSLLDYFLSGDEYFLVQEYIEGVALSKIVKNSGSFSEIRVRNFLRDFLPVIQFIHSLKAIHRDIKPPNILFNEQRKEYCLIDFGATKELFSNVKKEQLESEEDNELLNIAQTEDDQFVGTPGFAPPEQQALHPTYASDIYALGITCLFLLTGKTPIEFDSDPETGDFLWKSLVNVSNSFAEVLQKMLRSDVADRYQTADEVIQALSQEDRVDQPLEELGQQAARRDYRANSTSVESKATRIFLAYASEDREAVMTLYDRLKQQGYEPWLDRKK